MRASGRVWACLLVAACGGAGAGDGESALARELVALVDPAFGAGDTHNLRLLGDPAGTLGGHARARLAFLDECGAAADAAARQLVGELIDEDHLVVAVAGFLRSPAGTALVRGERRALAAFAWPAADFCRRTCALYGDAARVGAAAVRDSMQQAAEAMGSGGSPSPGALAIEIGAAWIEPEHAAAIAAFCASVDGRRWLEVRERAFARSEERFATLRRVALGLGYVSASGAAGTVDPILQGADSDPATEPARREARLPSGLDTPLPRSLPAMSGDAVQLRIGADGRVLYRGRQIFDGSRDELEVLAGALREIRRQGLADGTLRTEPTTHEGNTIDVIATRLDVEVEADTRYVFLARVMEAASAPDIAFLTVDCRLAGR